MFFGLFSRKLEIFFSEIRTIVSQKFEIFFQILFGNSNFFLGSSSYFIRNSNYYITETQVFFLGNLNYYLAETQVLFSRKLELDFLRNSSIYFSEILTRFFLKLK